MSLVAWLLIYSAVLAPMSLLVVPKVRIWTAPLYFVLIFAATYATSLLPFV